MICYTIAQLRDFSVPVHHETLLLHPGMREPHPEAWDDAHLRRLLYELNPALYRGLAAAVPTFATNLVFKETLSNDDNHAMLQGKLVRFDFLRFVDADQTRYRVYTHKQLMWHNQIHSHPIYMHRLGVIERVFLAGDMLYYVLRAHQHRNRGIVPGQGSEPDEETIQQRLARRRKLYHLISDE